MEEKKRKKSKKKNRSAQSQSALSHPEASDQPNAGRPDHIQCSSQNVDIQANPSYVANGNSRGKVEANDGVKLVDDWADRTRPRPEQTQVFVSEEKSSLPVSDPRVGRPDKNMQQETGSEDGPEFPIQRTDVIRVCNHTQTETDLNEEEVRLKEELAAKEQLIYELREALATETENAESLRVVVDELRTARNILEMGSQQQIQQLRAEILHLREMESDHLKLEVAKLVETQQLEEENTRLRGESIRLLKEVEEMRDLIERLQLEHQQLMAEMVAIQAGKHRLECGAAVHPHFEDEVANVKSPESSKQWVVTEDAVAQATTATEESCRQLAAAASLVEKLVSENLELVEKVNDQSALIDRLAQKYSFVMESQSSGFVEKCVSEQKDISTVASKEDSDEENSEAQPLYDVSSSGHKVVSSLDEEDIESQRTIAPSSATVDSTADNIIPIELDQLNEEISEEIICDATTGIASPANLQGVAFMNPNELKPFSDAPILGAPIRLFNFITKYVSGADLVKTK